MPRSTETFVVGYGPAALGIPVTADNHGKLRELAERGIVFADSRPEAELGGGSLRYKIPSNSIGEEFVRLDESKRGLLLNVLEMRAARELLEHGKEMVDLTLVQEYMKDLGKRVAGVLREFPNSGVLPNTTIDSIVREDAGDGKRFSLLDKDGRVWRSDNVVLATGAEEHKIDLGRNNDKLILSSDVLTEDSIDEVEAKLRANPRGEVVILGSSHSAFSVAWKLLEKLPEELLGPEKIKILHRSDIRLFYNTVEEAIADGYEFDPEQDVCKKTDRVFRYSGVRGNSKKLFKDILEGRENRVKLEKYEGELQSDEKAQELMDRSAVLVQSFGHKARPVKLFNARGHEIGPDVDERGKVEVDDEARVIGISREIIEGVYAVGLGHGRKPSKKTGGEPSAKKNPVDSVNYFHDVIAHDILQHIGIIKNS